MLRNESDAGTSNYAGVSESTIGERYPAPLYVWFHRGDTTPLEHLSWVLIGMSGWWSSNVIAAELPLFVAYLPEGPKMGNLLVVCTLLGKIFLLMFGLVGKRMPVLGVVVLCQVSAVTSLILCAVFWDTQHTSTSFVVLFCALLSGGVGSLSNVTVWVVASHASQPFKRATSIGMAIGGVVAIILVIVQMGGCSETQQRYPPAVTFCVAAFLQIVQGGICVRKMLTAPYVDPMRTVSRSTTDLTISRSISTHVVSLDGQDIVWDTVSNSSNVTGETSLTTSHRVNGEVGTPRSAHIHEVPQRRGTRYALYVFMLYLISYSMPSLIPYAATAYGPNKTQMTLLSILVLQNLGDTAARLMPPTKLVLIGRTSLFITAFLLYFGFAAEPSGLTEYVTYKYSLLLLPVSACIFFFFRGTCLSSVYIAARQNDPDNAGLAMLMSGAGQLGTTIAGIVSFVVVNFFNFFGH